MGKTAIFVLSVLHQMGVKPEPITALIVCHTHELAYQIKKEFMRFSKYMPDIKTEVVYGGEPIADHEKMLKTAPPHILVGTPGRVLALTRRKTLKLENVKYFIVDECDKVLQQLGMNLPSFFRHARGCAEDFHADSKRKAGYDVLCNTCQGHSSSLPQVYAQSNI
jgi:ATP-dependent RNA helicase UAP56/SUB2